MPISFSKYHEPSKNSKHADNVKKQLLHEKTPWKNIESHNFVIDSITKKPIDLIVPNPIFDIVVFCSLKVKVWIICMALKKSPKWPINGRKTIIISHK